MRGVVDSLCDTYLAFGAIATIVDEIEFSKSMGGLINDLRWNIIDHVQEVR